MWIHEEAIEISATPAEVWAVLSDVRGWKRWNAGIAYIELHGPFAVGTTFTMQPPETDAFVSTLIAVEEHRGFTDETVIDDIRVIVEHRIDALTPDGVRVTYTTEVTGPDAAEIGAMVTGDFPDVLRGLKSIVERRPAPAP
jgi:hypothetical protein